MFLIFFTGNTFVFYTVEKGFKIKMNETENHEFNFQQCWKVFFLCFES